MYYGVRKTPTPASEEQAATTTVAAEADTEVQRTFIPGSEWMYYKIYLGAKSADEILIKAIKPLCEALQNDGIIDKWFFIRYVDPKFHIRLRIQLKDVQYLGHVAAKVYGHLQAFVDDGLIWKIQTDTYQRELERYGSQSISQAERIFHADSIATIKILETIEGHEQEEEFRWLACFKAVNMFLDDFGMDLQQKHDFIKDVKMGFDREFNPHNKSIKQLGRKFKSFQKTLGELKDHPQLSPIWNQMVEILHQRLAVYSGAIEEVKHMYQEDDEMLEKLLWAYVHMIMNRLCRTKARKHEFVLHNILLRYYKMALHKFKNQEVQSV